MIYLLVFILIAIFSFAAQHTRNKYAKVVLYFFAIFIPSIISGLRHETIGTDVLYYGKDFFKAAYDSKNYLDFLNVLKQREIFGDLAFHTLNFIISKTIGNFQFALFTYTFITEVFFLLSFLILQKKYKIDATLGMVLIHLMFYNLSLNLLRQSIAVSIIFYSIVNLLDNKYIKTIFFGFFGFTFHSSSIIILLIVAVFYLVYSSKKRYNIISSFVFILLFGCLFFVSPYLIKFLVNIGMLKEGFLNYLPGGIYDTGEHFSKRVLFIPSLLTCTNFLFYSFPTKKYKMHRFFLLMSAVYLIFSFGNFMSIHFIRISYFFVPFTIVCQLLNMSNMDYGLKRSYQIFIIAVLTAIWFYEIVVLNFNQTTPYKFYWE